MTDQPTELYLELLKGVITRQIAPDRFRLIPESVLRRNSRLGAFAYLKLNALLSRFGLAICRVWFDPAARCEGSDWPGEAETMVGSKRLDNVHECVRSVIQQGVPGDFIETGVWRGGVTIFMRAALAA